MTIAAGFVCVDGVVLLTDSQFNGYIKRSGTKLWSFGVEDKVIGVAAAGYVVLMNEFIDGLQAKFQQTLPENLLQQAKDILYPIWLKHIQGGKGELQLLVAIRTSAGVTLYENQGSGTLATLRNSTQCYGAGSGLGNYLAEQMFVSPRTLQAGRNIAVFLLKQTKKYESDTCGGESHILLLPARFNAPPDLIDQGTIRALEIQLDHKESAVAAILAGIGIPGVDFNPETAQRRQETAETALSAALTTYISTEPAVMRRVVPEQSLGSDELSGVIQPPPEPED